MTETKSMSHIHVLVECALMVALGTVLMLVTLFKAPNGGSVTLLSMLPFVLVSFRHGTKWGLLTGFACALMQMLTGWATPLSGTVLAYFGMIMLDYVLAFTLLGTANVFAKPFKNRMLGIGVGTAVVCLIRFCCSFVSGFLIWDSLALSGWGAVTFSFTYNIAYMLPETILTTVAAVILYKVAPRLFGSEA